MGGGVRGEDGGGAACGGREGMRSGKGREEGERGREEGWVLGLG